MWGAESPIKTFAQWTTHMVGHAVESSVVIAEHKPISLAPLPTLEERHLTTRTVRTESFGPLHAFVPGHSDYHCRDNDAPILVLVPGLGMDALGFIRQLS